MPTTKVCPGCGTALTLDAASTAAPTCPGCGARLAARPKKKAAPTAPPKQAAPTPAPRDPRLILALAAGAFLAVMLVGLTAVGVVAFVLWPRPASQPPVVVLTPPPEGPRPAPPSIHPVDLPPEPPPEPSKPPAPVENPAPPEPPPEPPPAPPDLKPAPPEKPAAPEAPGDPVGAAVDKAVAYLKREAENDLAGDRYAGNRTGVMALVGLALLESGVPADDPAVRKAVQAVRDGAAALQDAPAGRNTYEMSLCVWFLDRLGEARDEELIQALAVQLIAAQDRGGLWEYISPPLTPAKRKEIVEVLEKYDVGKAIPAQAGLPAVCRFHRGKKLEEMKPATPESGARAPAGSGDLSLTQFAVLALWAARKHHVPVDRSLLLAEAYCRAKQAAEGSWDYGRGGAFMRDSMTCAGLMTLAVAHGVDPAKGAKADPTDLAVDKALVFLSDVFDRGIPATGPAPDKTKEDAFRAALTAVRQAFRAMVGRGGGLRKEFPKTELADFKAKVEKAAAADLPAEVKKHAEAILDALKEHDASPTPAKRQAVMTAARAFFADGAGLGLPVGFGFGVGQGRRFLRSRPPVDGTWDDIYFLWSMERMAVVYDFKTIAGHDWYAWGADLLVGYQNDDGSWSNAYSGAVDTGLALLFLKRANVAKDLTAKLQLIGIKSTSADRVTAASPGELLAPNRTAPPVAPPDKP